MLKLLESTERLANTSRELEERVQLPAEIGDLVLPVRLLSGFEDLPNANALLPHDWAVYSRGNREILVNGATFFEVSEELARATLAHEVGHAVYQRAQETQYDLGYAGLHEEFLADVLACKWGYCDEVCALRSSYGDEYCSLLRRSEQIPDFVKAMEEWLQQYSYKKIIAKWKGI
ncbi:MAG TPA: hypothetical protein VKM72_19300 [Thermoanaerobaculia bacterium]|nr:hypothetical protein [Thermoanaerobaculia bacterium]